MGGGGRTSTLFVFVIYMCSPFGWGGGGDDSTTSSTSTPPSFPTRSHVEHGGWQQHHDLGQQHHDLEVMGPADRQDNATARCAGNPSTTTLTAPLFVGTHFIFIILPYYSISTLLLFDLLDRPFLDLLIKGDYILSFDRPFCDAIFATVMLDSTSTFTRAYTELCQRPTWVATVTATSTL